MVNVPFYNKSSVAPLYPNDQELLGSGMIFWQAVAS
jgi:hypothetical protein